MRCSLLAMLSFAIVAPACLAQQACPLPQGCGTACSSGYTFVEEICYRDVVRYCCKVVPDVKKKTKVVYDCKCEPYCLPRLGRCDKCSSCGEHCCRCEAPPACGKVRMKKVLLKKSITEECPGWKCVVEKVCERVPYKIYRPVPCGAAQQPAAAARAVEQELPLIPAAASTGADAFQAVHPAALPLPSGTPPIDPAPAMLPVLP